jgi:hypothetical protein
MAVYKDYQNAVLDLVVDQGTDFMQFVDLKNDVGAPLDLTGYTPTLQIKLYFNTTRLFAASCVISGDPLLGRIRLDIPRTTTNMFNSSRYVYRVSATDGTDNVTLLSGQLLIDRF